jgi:hypothetical protein
MARVPGLSERRHLLKGLMTSGLNSALILGLDNDRFSYWTVHTIWQGQNHHRRKLLCFPLMTAPHVSCRQDLPGRVLVAGN